MMQLELEVPEQAAGIPPQRNCHLIIFIRIGLMLALLGGLRSLLRQFQKDKLQWKYG